jgi:hypothetical protein
MSRTQRLLTIAITSGLVAACVSLLAAQRDSMSPGRTLEPSFSTKLQRQIAEFDVAGLPMAQLAIRLAYEHRVPMALEYVDEDALRKPLRLKLKAHNLRGVIDAIVTALPEYHVDFSQGIVDVYCLAARRDQSNPLNTLILRYDVENLDTHFADAQLLCDINSLKGGGCGGSVAGGQWGPTVVTLRLANKRVYEILNAIVAQNGQALWVPITRPVKSSAIPMNFWYIYPLDPAFETSAIERLEPSVPERRAGAP